MSNMIKARAIASLLAAAAELARALATEMDDAAEIAVRPDTVNSMVGAVIANESKVDQLAGIFTSIKLLQTVAVRS